MKIKKLNLGCGNKYRDDCINCDYSKNVKADYYFDLEKDIFPFSSNKFDFIYIEHTLGHIKNVDSCMSEIYRVLKPNGHLIVIESYFKSDNAFSDLTRHHFFTCRTLDHFIKDTHLGKNHNFYYNFKFSKKHIKLYMLNSNKKFLVDNLLTFLANLNNRFFDIILSKFLPVNEIYFKLKK